MNERKFESKTVSMAIEPDEVIVPTDDERHIQEKKIKAKKLKVGDFLEVEAVTVRKGFRPSIDRVLGEIIELENYGETSARPKVQLVDRLSNGKETEFLDIDEWELAQPVIDISTNALIKSDE